MPDDVIWFYEQNGSHVGPVAARVVKQKCREGAISATTLCWQPAFGSTWRPVQSTEFAADLPKAAPPPPLPEPVAARPAAAVPPTQGTAAVVGQNAMPTPWMIALAPIIFAVAGIFLGKSMPNAESITNFGYVGATIAFCRMDVKQLLEAGYSNPPSAWWSLFAPVYLWQRGTLVGERVHFWVMMASYAVIIVILIASDSD